MVADWGENERGDSNGKTTQMSADPRAEVVWGACPETDSLTRFRPLRVLSL